MLIVDFRHEGPLDQAAYPVDCSIQGGVADEEPIAGNANPRRRREVEDEAHGPVGLGRSTERGAVTDGERRHPEETRRVAANHFRRHRRGDGRNVEARGQQVARASGDNAAREPKVKAEGEALPEEANGGTPRVGEQEGTKEPGFNGGAGATRQRLETRERRGEEVP